MTIGTIDASQIADVDRMLEGRVRGVRLRKNGVADLTVFADLLPVFADVLVVVAAEAAHRSEMPEVVGVRAPVDAHFGEADGPENVLYGFDGTVDLRSFRLVRVRVGLLVIGRENFGNRCDARIGGRI